MNNKYLIVMIAASFATNIFLFMNLLEYERRDKPKLPESDAFETIRYSTGISRCMELILPGQGISSIACNSIVMFF